MKNTLEVINKVDRKFKGFIFSPKCKDKESSLFHLHCIAHDIPHIKSTTPNPDYIPIGSVEWCLENLGTNIPPDYFPDFMYKYLYRKIGYNKHVRTKKLKGKCFVKPNDRYKKFDGYITDEDFGETRDDYIYSEVVNFVEEWRYYISKGKIITANWYKGEEKIIDPPELKVDMPEDFSGTLDMGLLDNGKFALVESHHPFACGWYNKNWDLYKQWITDGWEYMHMIKDCTHVVGGSDIAHGHLDDKTHIIDIRNKTQLLIAFKHFKKINTIYLYHILNDMKTSKSIWICYESKYNRIFFGSLDEYVIKSIYDDSNLKTISINKIKKLNEIKKIQN